MRLKLFIVTIVFLVCGRSLFAQDKAACDTTSGGFYIGGYAEAAYSHSFNDKSGALDLMHLDFWVGYGFRYGWAIEVELDLEYGAGISFEQFVVEKSFAPWANISFGYLVVPFGSTNPYGLPMEYFGVYYPEGECGIFPCTWKQPALSFWGETGSWGYEVMLLGGLDSDLFTDETWVAAAGCGNLYDFKFGNTLGGAFRVDNYSVEGLTLALSGYIGNTYSGLNMHDASYVSGTAYLGAFDFIYDDYNFIARGNLNYGYLANADKISAYNIANFGATAVGSEALAAGVEVGYDFFSLNDALSAKDMKFYLFGRYDYYDSMFGSAASTSLQSSISDDSGIHTSVGITPRHRLAAGINFCPVKNLHIKAEYSHGIPVSSHGMNLIHEPKLSVGITYLMEYSKR